MINEKLLDNFLLLSSFFVFLRRLFFSTVNELKSVIEDKKLQSNTKIKIKLHLKSLSVLPYWADLNRK